MTQPEIDAEPASYESSTLAITVAESVYSVLSEDQRCSFMPATKHPDYRAHRKNVSLAISHAITALQIGKARQLRTRHLTPNQRVGFTLIGVLRRRGYGTCTHQSQTTPTSKEE